jgi:hypothetical protein
MWYVRKGKGGDKTLKSSKETAMTDAENLSIGSVWSYYVLHFFNTPNEYWVIAKFRGGKQVAAATVEI